MTRDRASPTFTEAANEIVSWNLVSLTTMTVVMTVDYEAIVYK